jgi:hypothetical protein
MSWEAVVALATIAAVAVALWISRRQARFDVERVQFALTPLVAVEGGDIEGVGGRRSANAVVHLQGEGFAHNLTLSLFFEDAVASPAPAPSMAVWTFRKAPAEVEVAFEYPVNTIPEPNRLVRLEGRYENGFGQELQFVQHGVLDVHATRRLQFESGAPEYTWPWTSFGPPTSSRHAFGFLRRHDPPVT